MSNFKIKYLVFGVAIIAVFCYAYFSYILFSYGLEDKRKNREREYKLEQVEKALKETKIETKLAESKPQQLPKEDPEVNKVEEKVVAVKEALDETQNTPVEEPVQENVPEPESVPAAAPIKINAPPGAIVVNGDKVEYSTGTKEVSAQGNVEVDYKGSKLSSEKLTMNTETKTGKAEGGFRLDDQKGVIKGSEISYNFEKKTGSILDADFYSSPYFGKARRVEKVSDDEFIALDANMTTCSFDHPHYHFSTREMDFYPHDKLQAEDVAFYIGDVPVLYVPRFSRTFKDPLMHLQVTPGNRKDWGQYFLSTYRANLTSFMDARVYLDYRSKLGLAEGFGLNYSPPGLGKGDFKFYYTDEQNHKAPAGTPDSFQEYLVRWRHKWDIDEQTNFIAEFYKIGDEKRKFDPESEFLKDYFYREFEKDSEPRTYAFFHHAFPNSLFDFLAQQRTNHWFDQVTKLPEGRYLLPSFKIGSLPFYFETNTNFANFDKKAEIEPVTPVQENVARFDSLNKLSLPFKLSFLELDPFVANRGTIYDKGSDGESFPARSIFYSGVDLSTKFFKLYDVKSNFLGMNINGLRHVITPTIQYSYNHEPSISSDRLKHIDDVDLITSANVATFGLSNKLQTKRNGQSVDFLDFRVESAYEFEPRFDDQANKRDGSGLADLYFNLKLLPYSWMRFESDALYNKDNNYFSDANYDFTFNAGKDRTFGIGQRYQRNGGNQVTGSFTWRFNPKWKFTFYNRYELSNNANLVQGMAEQEYSITRDLHCWEASLSFNRKKDEGSTLWLIFRLKAFPEMEFGFNQSYHNPSSGSQSN